MAFRLIKLVSAQTIIADAYKVRELEKHLKSIWETENLDQDSMFSQDSLLLLVNPVEIIYRLTEDMYISSTLAFYLPHAEDIIIPLPENKIITLATPNTKILAQYNEFVIEQRQKIEQKRTLKKNFGSEEANEMAVQILNEIDPKKSTKH